jgi:hypothetical protein
MTIQTRTALLAGAAFFSLASINADAAESGFFMGGSIGTAAVEANVNDGIVSTRMTSAGSFSPATISH